MDSLSASLQLGPCHFTALVRRFGDTRQAKGQFSQLTCPGKIGNKTAFTIKFY